MRITAKADYAVRAAVELAAAGDEPMKGEKLAEAQQIPLQFLEHILLELKHARLVRARRGAREARWRMARGVIAVALGAAVLVWPSITVTVLVRLVGALLIGSGLLCFVSARVLRDAGQNQRDVRLDIVS